MNLNVIPVRSKAVLKKFVKLPWKIYKGNKCWVPPLISDVMNTLDPKKNSSLSAGNFEMFLVLSDGKPVGRIFAGIDTALNEKKNEKMGYISLFESINEYEVAKLLFDSALSWLKSKGISLVRGPLSPIGAGADENKGLLINAFDKPPVLMNSYNPPYYETFFEKYGFTKDYDLYAYYLDRESLFRKNPSKALEYAMKKYNFRVDPINLKNLDEEIKAIKHVLDLAVPDEWPDMVAPSLDDVREMAKKLLPVADPELIIMARSGDEPIGFGIALPNYNQILIHLNGRLTPLALLKYLYYKRKIDSLRFFIMFVVPAFRKKGVSYAIYHQCFINALKKGMTWGEGSTIGETNIRMRSDIESFGGQHYKTYRVYKKEI